MGVYTLRETGGLLSVGVVCEEDTPCQRYDWNALRGRYVPKCSRENVRKGRLLMLPHKRFFTMRRLAIGIVILLASAVATVLACMLYANIQRKGALAELEALDVWAAQRGGDFHDEIRGTSVAGFDIIPVSAKDYSTWRYSPVDTITQYFETHTRLDDSVFLRIGRFPELKELQICGRNDIRGGGFVYLAHCRLESLFICSGDILDKNLRYLGQLQSLRTLGLVNQPISDEGMKQLATLRNIENLTLNGTLVQGAFLADAAYRKNLVTLELADTMLSDKTARTIADLPVLRSVDLSYCKVSDEVVETIRRRGIAVETSSHRAEWLRSWK